MKNNRWESFNKLIEIWWQGSRLTEGYRYQNLKLILNWQHWATIEDDIDGFNPMGYREKCKDKYGEGAPNTHLMRHLFTGRRTFSSLVCTFIVPVLPIEIGFRFLNAAVDTWHARVTEEGKIDYPNKTSIQKAGWWVRKTVATVAKVCARVTDFMIVTPANGFRNAVDAAPHALVPVQAGIDANNADRGQGVKQFFKTWGNACLAVIKGLFKASRPAVILTPFGVAAPLGSAILTSGVVSHVPSVGNALTSGLTTISNSGSYLPGLVPNVVSIPTATASGVAQAAVVNIIPPIMPNSSSRVTNSAPKTNDAKHPRASLEANNVEDSRGSLAVDSPVSHASDLLHPKSSANNPSNAGSVANADGRSSSGYSPSIFSPANSRGENASRIDHDPSFSR